MITLFILFLFLILLVVATLGGLLAVFWPVLLIIFAIWLIGRFITWLF